MATPHELVSVRYLVDDVDAAVAFYTTHLGFTPGVSFLSELVTGPGGSQILIEDPSGSLVELFQPRLT